MTHRSRGRIRSTVLGWMLAAPILFGAAPSWALWDRSGDYAGLSEALAAGDCPSAAGMLRRLADDGDTLAQTLLAEFYLGEPGTAQNVQMTANQWIAILDGATAEEFTGFVSEAADWVDLGPRWRAGRAR